jgi:hypothetical protein
MKASRLFHQCGLRLAILFATWALAALRCHSQVTYSQVTNGLIDYYPLNTVLPGNTTPDIVSRRDLRLVNMTSANIVPATHLSIEPSNTCLYFNQSGGPTVAYYNTTGQNPFDGSGDFLPFINQRGATMNFWVKGLNPLNSNEYRLMGECANDGQSSPFFSISTKGSAALGTNVSFFLRAQNPVTDPNGGQSYRMSDGTYEYPVINYYWNQGANDTTNNVLDGTWHMLTVTISTNGDMHVYVDGNYDPGDQGGPQPPAPFTDNEGNLTVAPSLPVTNGYYSTNNYPGLNTTNGSPTLPYVHWLMPDLCNSGVTTFGGFIRNNSTAGGPPCYLSDLGFWSRALSQEEILFVMTNGVAPCYMCLAPPPPHILNFSAGFGEFGQGHQVNLSWTVTGVSNSPGTLVISGVGDVSAIGPAGSTNVTLPANQTQTQTFTLTVHSGIIADIQASVSVKILPGVPSDWNLIQRWDGLFTPTTSGVNGHAVTTLGSIYSGVIDKWNVVNVNGNESLSARSGYRPDATNSAVGFDTLGSVTYAALNNLTIPPGQQNTLFFRFSIHDPGSFNSSLGIVSGMDLVVGVTDFGFGTGPVGGGGTIGVGNGGTVGPGFHIVRADPNYQPSPFDLTAFDYSGTAVTNSFSYTSSIDPSGLMTNVNYMVWLDISNNYTAENISGGVTNTINMPLYSMWLQKPGDTSRTLLFSNFHGDRDYSQYGVNSDFPTPYLNKVFVSMASEAFQNGDAGAFIETNNMILLDDFYLSTNGLNGTIPRLFNLSSIVRGATNATITWYSLGSMFQTNTYSVQRTFSLNPPAWTTLVTGLPSGGDLTSFTDTTVGSADQAYYRISWP